MSALSSWELFVKYALFIFNFVFWEQTPPSSSPIQLLSPPPLPPPHFLSPPSWLVLEFWLWVYGCGLTPGRPDCLKEKMHQKSSSPFFFFLLLIFAAEVAAGIWGLSNKDKVIEEVTEFYKQTHDNYKATKQDALRETLKIIHFGLNCCGLTGTLIDGNKDLCPKQEGLELIVTTSCPQAIDDVFNNRLHIIGGVGIGIGVIMIFGMIFSMMLCCAIKRSRDFV
ncbi:hypothetical protein INR49_010045 [Caranx melampygus]|nr:hypothetical protein INR49_010045 [Caranx melampygus]